MGLREQIVPKLVLEIYAESLSRDEFAVGLGRDRAHGNQCSVLTLELLKELRARNMPSRRELHETSFGYHFVIAHALDTDEPRLDDFVSELTPWQFGPPNRSGPLFGKRDDISRILLKAGVDSEVYKLRSFESITIAHTTALTPEEAHNELG